MAEKDYERAAQLSAESLEVFRELNDQPNVAICLHRLGALAHRRGDRAEARCFLDESLALRRPIGDRRGVIPVLVELANALGEEVRPGASGIEVATA